METDGLTRREVLGAAIRLGGLAALAGPLASLAAACETAGPRVRLGIAGGSQTLWRYLAISGDAFLGQSGYQTEFRTYPTEAEAAAALQSREIDVLASVISALPEVRQASGDIRFFLPIAWLEEGFPIMVPGDSPLQSVADLAGQPVAIYPERHPATLFWRTLVQANYGQDLLSAWRVNASPSPESVLDVRSTVAGMVASTSIQAFESQGYRQLSNLSREWEKQRTSDRLMIFGGYMASAAFLRNYRPFVRAFVQANQDALRRYQQEQLAFLEIVSRPQEGLPAIPLAENQAIARYLGLGAVAPERMRLDQVDVQDASRLLDLMRAAGVTSQPLTGEQALVTGGDL